MRVVQGLALTFEVTRHLGLDDAGRDRDVVRHELLQQQLPGLDRLVGELRPGHLLAQVGVELVESVELARKLGEVVVGPRQVALLDGGRGDRDVGLLPGVVAPGERRS